MSLINRELWPACEALARASVVIEDSAEVERIANASLVVLRHAIPHHVGEIAPGQHLLWDIRSLLSNASQLRAAHETILSCLTSVKWEVDTVVAMSAPAAPLAALLANDSRLTPNLTARLYYLDNYTGQLSDQQFEPGQRVLLFDSLVRSGWHASVGYDLIRTMGASIVGMFTLCLGARDSSDVHGLSSPTLDLLTGGELEFVYSWRQLLRLAAGSPGR